ncbi:MAG: hypothetical protein FJ303_09340 [Planctomycetes bacterium]|nr:hypothetical protein [Planctomycetota bacterium]
MPWHIGIDEAGYGPNLGPFVMTLVACNTPDDGCLWNRLKSCFRRFDDTADDRLIVADSKLVYSPNNGWADLERTALTVCSHCFDQPTTLATLLDHLATDDMPMLANEAWFTGASALPMDTPGENLVADIAALRQASKDEAVTWGFCRSVIVPAPGFNDLIDRWDSKAAVLSVAITRLMQQCLENTRADPMRFTVDKHGGRNAYYALLQHVFANGLVYVEEESRQRSVYRVDGLDRQIRITFMPKADVEHFTVALASMISKYVRELLMAEFNRFWQAQVPGLEPTAGYPQDAVRYIQAIRPAMLRLGIPERAVWRRR